MTIKDYKDLTAWQKGMRLAVEIYRLTKLLPKEETYGLVAQLRRAAGSVPSNIAEGYSRESTTEYARFLKIARGSLYEVETQLYLCEALEYLDHTAVAQALSLSAEIGKMLNTMLRRLNGQMNPDK